MQYPGKPFLLLIPICLLAAVAMAQQQMGPYMAYGPESKYFANLNYRVYETKNGYLWFGTQNGLVRFDGKRYKNYFSNSADPNSLSDNTIFDIAEDRNGFLWMAGFYHGVTSYNPGTGRFKKYPSLSKDNNPYYGVNSILSDRDKDLWFATSGRGLAQYDFAADSFIHYFPEPGQCRDGSIRGFNHVTDIAQDKKDNNMLWVGTFHGLYTFNKKTRDFVFYPSGLSQGEAADVLFTNIELDNNGLLWLGTWGLGLHCFDTRTKKFLPARSNASVPIVYDLTQVNDSLIYTACLDNGLYKLNVNTGAFTNITPPVSPADQTAKQPSIQKVSLTPDAGIFIGGNYYVYQQHPDFTRLSGKLSYPDADGKSYIGLSHCLWDPFRRKYWLSTDGGSGVYSVDENLQQVKAMSFDKIINKKDRYFRNCVLDGLNRVWALSYEDGLFVWDDVPGIFKKAGDLLPVSKETAGSIRRIKNNKEGDLWLLADSSLLLWHVKSNLVETFPLQWSPDYQGVHSLANAVLTLDPDGDPWLLTGHGLFHCRRNEKKVDHIFKTGTDNNSLYSTIVLAGAFNKYNDLWLTSGNGIQVLSRKNYKVLANHNIDLGLPSMSVRSIATDSLGRIWAGTTAGIGIFNPSTKIWQLFNRMDGLEMDYLDGYLDITSNGKIVIDQHDGFLVKDPQVLTPEKNPPLMHLTAIWVNDEPYGKGVFPENINRLQLPYDSNNVSIEFAAMDWCYPFKTSYRWQINGDIANSALIKSSSECKINLAGLEPGTYSIHIKALNANGNWSKDFIFTIIIKPPFWKTWWFLLLCVILLAAIMYSLYRYRISQFMQMQRVRNAISRDLHDEIGATLSSVNMLSAVALKKAGSSNEAAPIIQQIKESVQQAGESIDDIVWSVNPSNDSAQDTFARIRKHITELAEAKSVNCEINIDDPGNTLKLPMELRRDLYLICKEAVNNALKYSGCSLLRLDIRLKGHQLLISIADNGKGFDTSVIRSTGRNGISNMRHRVEKHQGRFHIGSVPGSGTTITCSINI